MAVAGELPNPQPHNGWNTIDLPLILDWLARPRSIVHHEFGKPSITHWRIASEPAPGPGMTRLDLEPVTGRSHQRACLQAIGFPIGRSISPASAGSHGGRLLLHARHWRLRTGHRYDHAVQSIAPSELPPRTQASPQQLVILTGACAAWPSLPASCSRPTASCCASRAASRPNWKTWPGCAAPRSRNGHRT
jgi:hypothetical protein